MNLLKGEETKQKGWSGTGAGIGREEVESPPLRCSKDRQMLCLRTRFSDGSDSAGLTFGLSDLFQP